ncbi:hypothetical protein ACFOON_17135 [Novosphingobium piscinae]|uniref:Uncharacterized protein n=1 Tax=Novosphingobium piscinae TaxID=1507448 RepID=A0A7X1FYW2_9SPHN|nr:hypothetical protein [Novosphingobium piscinae]MBC2669516.1 hypothetical protein [Novosphingobium piscinae]
MWTFQQFFAEAQVRGWSAHEAANRLLHRIRAPAAQGRVVGLRKEEHCRVPSIAECHAAGEYLGPVWTIARQDFEPSAVPCAIWREFTGVGPDLVSVWQDDEEDPMEWAEVDWLAGTIKASDWSNSFVAGEPDDAVIEFTGLQIAPALGQDILTYSDDELAALVVQWPGTNSAVLWEALKQDPKAEGVTQGAVRKLWKNRRNPEGKRTGRPPSK